MRVIEQEGKTIFRESYLISGAASGIGKQLAIDMLATGREVILVDKDIAGLQMFAEVHTGRCTIVEHDFIEANGLDEKLTLAVNERGKIRGLVHVAGISSLSPLKSAARSELERVMSINTYAAFDLVKFCTKAMNSHTDGMSIVFVSSVYSLVGAQANSLYAMSKGALNSFCRSLAIEFAPRRIRFNCVAPGFIRTAMLENIAERIGGDYLSNLEKLHPLGLGQPKDVSNAIQFFLSDNSRWITGAVLPVDGGYTAI